MAEYLCGVYVAGILPILSLLGLLLGCFAVCFNAANITRKVSLSNFLRFALCLMSAVALIMFAIELWQYTSNVYEIARSICSTSGS